MRYQVDIHGKTHQLVLEKASAPQQPDRWVCRLGGHEIVMDAVQTGADTLSIVIDGKSFEIRRENAGETPRVFVHGRQFQVTLQDARSLKSRRRAGPCRSRGHEDAERTPLAEGGDAEEDVGARGDERECRGCNGDFGVARSVDYAWRPQFYVET